LKTIEAGGQDRFRDGSLEMIAKSDHQSDVLYPHDIHTYYVDCDSCHPRPFVQQSGKNLTMRMRDMSEGKWCGKCHGKVAFPLEDCTRCHILSKDRKENGTQGFEQIHELGK
jgi:c(7)-type cytochrome triheme protein